jgi:hypothetical protein
MKIFSGKRDRWGIGMNYCAWDNSLEFELGNLWFAIVFHKFWKN